MPPGEGEWGEEGMGKKGLHWKWRGEEACGVFTSQEELQKHLFNSSSLGN